MKTIDNSTLVTATGGYHWGPPGYAPAFAPYAYPVPAPRWAYGPAYAAGYMPYAPVPARWAGAWWPSPRR